MKVPLRFIYIGVILIIMAILYAIQRFLDKTPKDSGSGSGTSQENYTNQSTIFSENMNAQNSSYGSGSGSSATDSKQYTYDYGNVNVQYHDSIDDINAQSNDPLLFNQIIVKDPSGNTVSIPTLSGQTPAVYYTAGSQIYTPNNFVPTYEDSVYLSRSTGMSTLANYGPTAQLKGGFCTFYANDPTALETKCNALDINTCASTDCCVLLGGSKCVSGNAQGPKMPANYTDTMIINKDVYYYKGNCYGHCA